MPHRFAAIICDIDGCLGPESHAPLDAKALSRIAAHNQSAIAAADRPVLTLCSGRPQPYAEALCRLLGNSTVPCVAENGVWLYDPRDNRFLRDPAILPAHLGAVRDASLWIEQSLGPQGVVIQPGKTASISLWHPDTAFLKGLMPSLVETFRERGWPLRVSDTVAWINCDLAHVSKATGIRRLMAMTGLTTESLAGVGDSFGDMAIRESVAYFACPVNADGRLKKVADYVSPKPEVEGVLDILDQLTAKSSHLTGSRAPSPTITRGP